MPLQNRVLPTGEIVADPARGTFMGNRGGCIHDADKRLAAARWSSATWIICRLAFKGRHREVMAPRRYTELFFLDEAVAIAAGHRPCAECRRQDYKRFKAAFEAGNGPAANAPAIDKALHAARVTRQRRQITHVAPCAALPDGTFIAEGGESWLLRGAELLRFTPAGYTERRPRPLGPVTVLTPAPAVAALAKGYRPHIHESAGS